MKIKLKFHILQGVLVAYVAREAWVFSTDISFRDYPWDTDSIVGDLIKLGFCGFLLFALLFRPVANAKKIFGIVCAFAVVLILSDMNWLVFAYPYMDPDDISRYRIRIFRELMLSFGAAGVAWLFLKQTLRRAVHCAPGIIRS